MKAEGGRQKYTPHGWNVDVSGIVRVLLHRFSPLERALVISAVALAPRGPLAKVKLPT